MKPLDERWIFLGLLWVVFSGMLLISLVYGFTTGWNVRIPGRGGGYTPKDGLGLGLFLASVPAITSIIVVRQARATRKREQSRLAARMPLSGPPSPPHS